MPQEIYNEGRVVGFSAWELFMRNAISNGVDPNDIPNEAQWLTAMIGSGSSIVLKISQGTTSGIHDFPLPEGSNLTPNTGAIIANPFLGECTWGESPNSHWATKVISYSPLISNTSDSCPSSTESSVPSGTYSITDYKNVVSEFTKILDGIVYTKNADWYQTPNPSTPYKDIDPDFPESSTVIRLYINSNIIADTYIIFTGFTNKYILQGLSAHALSDGTHGSTDTANNNWRNGGMLGPEVTPWATKIIFSVPSAAFDLTNSITRTLPSDAEYTAKTIDGIAFKNVTAQVKSVPIIDFNSINLSDYYIKHSSEFTGNPMMQEDVTSLTLGNNENCNSLISLYPGMTAARIADTDVRDSSKIFPPALYAAQVTAEGTQSLVPVDVAAPGTVKVFRTHTQASNYRQQLPDNFSIYYNSTNKSFSFATPDNASQWPGTAKFTNPSQNNGTISVTAGNNTIKMVTLTNPFSSTDYDLSGSGGTVTPSNTGKLTWQNMLTALSSNKSVELLSDKLRAANIELNGITVDHLTRTGLGITSANELDFLGTRWIVINPDFTQPYPWKDSDTVWMGSYYDGSNRYIRFDDAQTPATLHVSERFMRFGPVPEQQGEDTSIKLYVAKNATQTSGMRAGDIGIGW